MFYKKYLFLLLFLSFLMAKDISVYPQIKYSYASDNEQYAIKNIVIQDYEFALLGRFSGPKISLLVRMGYHLVDGTLQNPSDFSRAQGMQYFVQDKGLDNQKNYWISDMKLEYGDSSIYFYLNKWDKHWGPGVNSLTMSNKIPSFYHFGFNWEVNKNINFEYFHGKVKSSIDDTLYSRYYNFVGYNPIDVNRNIVGHRLEWRPYNKIIISGSELIVYANRELEMTYLLPFASYFPIQSYIGETDNVVMSFDIEYLYNKMVSIYGALLIDELAPSYIFKKDNNNWFAWQSGIKIDNFIILNSVFNLEYNWTDHRVYRHRYPVNDYYSWNYPIGFWAGPHAEELYFKYSVKFNKNKFELYFSDARRGVLTYDMLESQYSLPGEERLIYNRYSDGFERKRMLNFSFFRNFYDMFDLQVSYTYIDWKNAGEVYSIKGDFLLDDVADLIKNSIGIELKYNFR